MYDRDEDERPSSASDERLPVGFMMAMAQNMRAMEKYAALSEQQRAELIHRAQNTHTQQQMRALVDHIDDFFSIS